MDTNTSVTVYFDSSVTAVWLICHCSPTHLSPHTVTHLSAHTPTHLSPQTEVTHLSPQFDYVTADLTSVTTDSSVTADTDSSVTTYSYVTAVWLACHRIIKINILTAGACVAGDAGHCGLMKSADSWLTVSTGSLVKPGSVTRTDLASLPKMGFVFHCVSCFLCVKRIHKILW